MDISPLRFVRASARGSSPTTGVIEFTHVCEDLGKFSSDVVLLSVVSFIVLKPFVDKVVSEFCKSVVDFVWNCWSFLTVVDPSEAIAVPYNRGKYSWYVHLKLYMYMNIFNFRINSVKWKYLRSLYLKFFKNLKFNLVHVFNNVFDLLIFEAVFSSSSKSEYIIPNEYYCKNVR